MSQPTKILITGATGNVGKEVVAQLLKRNIAVRVAVSDIEKAKTQFGDTVEYVQFEFGKAETYEAALDGANKIFLMRPPAISDVKTYLFPFIDRMEEKNIKQVVFLSLQGAEFNPVAPHSKVEKYMRKTKVPYTFIRPSFFMQNLSTTHRKQIRELDKIIVPAGNGRTSFVDVRDIGEAAAVCFTEEDHLNKAYTITGNDALTYFEVAEILSKYLGRKIEYTNPSGKAFAEQMRSEGLPEDMIKVMKMIYLVAKLGLASGKSDDFVKLTKRQPTSFEQFVQDYKDVWVR